MELGGFTVLLDSPDCECTSFGTGFNPSVVLGSPSIAACTVTVDASETGKNFNAGFENLSVETPSAPVELAPFTPYTPGYTWNRRSDWAALQPALTVGTSDGNPSFDAQGMFVWSQEWVQGGGPANDLTPWFKGSRNPMVWDDSWFSTGIPYWDRANNTEPVINDVFIECADATNAPIVAWHSPIKPAGSPEGLAYVAIDGKLRIGWGNIGGPGYLDVCVVKHALSPESYEVLAESTFPYTSTGIWTSMPIHATAALRKDDEILITSKLFDTADYMAADADYDSLSITYVGLVDVPRNSASTPKLEALSITPNPGHGPMDVAFDLPRAGTVDVVLYDAAGRRLASLVSGLPASAGSHCLRASLPTGLPPGVILARLVVNGVPSQSAAKLVVVRP